MNLISKLVELCLEPKKIEKKDERVYISCSNFFLRPTKCETTYNETEKLLDEMFS
ncbi:MAG: hypothetical protein J6R29_04740 [Clostridia bacterium]|nr:hypothetical protein [Clostridia bacterium]